MSQLIDALSHVLRDRMAELDGEILKSQNEREVAALKSRTAPQQRQAQVTNFPAPAVDPLLTAEEDGEFDEDSGLEEVG